MDKARLTCSRRRLILPRLRLILARLRLILPRLRLILPKLRLSELEIMRFGILGTGRCIIRPVPKVWNEIRYSIKKRVYGT